MRTCLRFILFAVIFCSAAPARAGLDVTVRALPSIEGLACAGMDINQHGEVLVNCTDTTGLARAYVWVRGKQKPVTGRPDTTRCLAINDSRQVLCNSRSGPYLWKAGVITELGPQMQFGIALNDLGEVFGFTNMASRPGGVTLAGLRRADGSIVTVPPEVFTFRALNNLSQVPARLAGGPLFDKNGIWSPRTGYVPLVDAWDLLTDINDAGQMTSQSDRRAALFTPGTGWQVLPHPDGFVDATSWAASVDSAGQVTGYLTNGTERRAMFWPTSTEVVDLGTYLSRSTIAAKSTSLGQIVGTALDPVSRGEQIALLWTITDSHHGKGKGRTPRLK